ncbi:hypothetical protein [Aureliella helgolandensis]|uniref:Transmembrane protein n=1 Tax=Aureliella helgolandensis TaxID=2527968 RepID=A0A518G2I2_9BACT|nr:hypothetical protein [Aureliella helgolandensis]QDV22802.1 hypothetical protein Q31a_10930 [Aureliella helgolandensis]
MPHVRLLGLILFITTVFLALAAAATKTTSIKFKRRDSAKILNTPAPAQAGELPTGPVLPLPSDGAAANPKVEPAVEFVSVPIVWPLMITGALGMLIWFVPAPLSALSSTSSKSKRRKSRSRRSKTRQRSRR